MTFKVKNAPQTDVEEAVSLQNTNLNTNLNTSSSDEKISKNADVFNLFLLTVLYTMQGEVCFLIIIYATFRIDNSRSLCKVLG
jgi:hypothetical protein